MPCGNTHKKRLNSFHDIRCWLLKDVLDCEHFPKQPGWSLTDVSSLFVFNNEVAQRKGITLRVCKSEGKQSTDGWRKKVAWFLFFRNQATVIRPCPIREFICWKRGVLCTKKTSNLHQPGLLFSIKPYAYCFIMHLWHAHICNHQL